MPFIWVPPHVALFRRSEFLKREIEAYEAEILSNPHSNEREAAEFFSRFPKFLLLGSGKELKREIVIVNSTGRPVYRLDFFRRNFGSDYWDIVELKSPQKPLFVNTSGIHPRLSAEVQSAISQAQDYRDFLDGNELARQRLKRRGIPVCRPRILVVVGRDDGELPQDSKQILLDRARRGPVDLWSYSDLFRFAKDHYQASGTICLPGDLIDSTGNLPMRIQDLGVGPSGITGADSDNRTDLISKVVSTVRRLVLGTLSSEVSQHQQLLTDRRVHDLAFLKAFCQQSGIRIASEDDKREKGSERAIARREGTGFSISISHSLERDLKSLHLCLAREIARILLGYLEAPAFNQRTVTMAPFEGEAELSWLYQKEQELEVELLAMLIIVPDAFIHLRIEESMFLPAARVAYEFGLDVNWMSARMELYRRVYGYQRTRELLRQRSSVDIDPVQFSEWEPWAPSHLDSLLEARTSNPE